MADLVGDASHEHSAEVTKAASPHHDHVDVLVFRVVGDLLSGGTDEDIGPLDDTSGLPDPVCCVHNKIGTECLEQLSLVDGDLLDSRIVASSRRSPRGSRTPR